MRYEAYTGRERQEYIKELRQKHKATFYNTLYENLLRGVHHRRT